MFSFRHKPEGSGGQGDEEKHLSHDAEDYIKKLADSFIQKAGPSKDPDTDERPSWTEAEKKAPKVASRRPVSKRREESPAEQHPQEKPPAKEKPAAGGASREELRAATAEAGKTPEELYYDEKGNLLPGSIIAFEDGGMGIFQKTLPQKDYDVVYMLESDGNSKPQGMPLYNYEYKPVGRMSREHMSLVTRSNTWERDLILFSLTNYEDRDKIPAYSGEMETPTEQAGRPDPREMSDKGDDEKLVRGREISIPFGPGKAWDAVYWGQDELGDVVAHKTHGSWALMHLELDRFRKSITYGEVLDGKKLKEMEKDFIPE